MRRILIDRHGGPEVLRPEEAEAPTPGPGEALVRVAAVGVNFIDTYQREGVYPMDLPYVPGSEGAGTIADLGPDTGDGAGRFRVGDRVVWCQVPGSYAEYVVAPVDTLVAVPDGIDDRVAASMLLQGITAQYLLTECGHTAPGDTVLVTAGAGGVGQILIQMAVARGLTVVTTTSTEEKAALCRDLGAHHVLLYPEATPERIRELSDGGVAAVFDGVGRATFDTGLDSLRPRGYMVLFGAASGPVPPVDPQRLNAAGSVFLTRPSLAAYVATDDEFRRRADEVLGALADGTVRLSVGEVVPLSEAGNAHRMLESRATTGSVVLDPTR